MYILQIWLLDGRTLRTKLLELQAQMGVMTGERRQMSGQRIGNKDSDGESHESSAYMGHTRIAKQEHIIQREESQMWLSSRSQQENERRRDMEVRKQRYLRTAELLRRSGLLDITIKTAELIRRNHQLQRELMTLEAETRAFVKSVLSNPENKRLRLSSGSSSDSLAMVEPDTFEHSETCDSVTCNSAYCAPSDTSNDNNNTSSSSSRSAQVKTEMVTK